MTQAYTPGLIVSPKLKVTKIRELPIPGRCLVKEGDLVSHNQVVLAAELPGDVEILRLAERTGLELDVLRKGLKVKPGDFVTKGQNIFESKSFFGLFNTRIDTPVTGTIEFFSEANGHLGIRQPPRPLEVLSYISGRVIQVDPQKSVTIEAEASMIQGIFGVGGERFGITKSLDIANDQTVTADFLSQQKNIKDSVLIGGKNFSIDALSMAKKLEVSGIVTGSIDAKILREFLGYDVGLAITGDEDLPFTLIVTEGFGELALSARIKKLADTLAGKVCSVNGATQVRAGAMRPEMIVSNPNTSVETNIDNDAKTLSAGSPVRVIRVPYFGLQGEVIELPLRPETLESGAIVRVAHIKLSDGRKVVIPRANLELI